MARVFEGADRIAREFGSGLESRWSSTLARVTQIQAQTINVPARLLIDLGNAIVQTITDVIARTAASVVTDFIGAAIGFALAPVTGGASIAAGTGIPGLGPNPAGGFAMSPAGGNTFVMQTFDARSTLQELVSPGGSFRRSSDGWARWGDSEHEAGSARLLARLAVERPRAAAHMTWDLLQ